MYKNQYNNQHKYGNQRNNNQKPQKPQSQQAVKEPFVELTKLNYVDLAEKRIKNYKGITDRRFCISNSKIRNLFSLLTNIYELVKLNKDDKLSEDIQSKILYTKMKFAYEAGRDRDVKDFITQTQLLQNLVKIGDNKDYLLLFCHYMESLVAYHKYYIGKD